MNKYARGILRRIGTICGVSAANTPTNTTINNPGNLNWLEGVLVQKSTAATSDDRTYIGLLINSEQVVQQDAIQNYYSQNIQNEIGYIPIGRILTGNDNMQVQLISPVVSGFLVTFIYAQKSQAFITAARNNEI